MPQPGMYTHQMFLQAAQVADDVAAAAEFGIMLPEGARMRVDMQAVVERKNSVVSSLAEGVSMLLGGADVVAGTVRFIESHTVEMVTVAVSQLLRF